MRVFLHYSYKYIKYDRRSLVKNAWEIKCIWITGEDELIRYGRMDFLSFKPNNLFTNPSYFNALLRFY